MMLMRENRMILDNNHKIVGDLKQEKERLKADIRARDDDINSRE